MLISLSGLLLALVWSAGPGLITAQAQHEGFMVTNETAPLYRKVPEIESQLYGHAYPNQPISRRISRIERTLFTVPQRGALETRMKNIEARINEKNAQQSSSAQSPMLAYLEEKLFQRTYSELPLSNRLTQLETQVFGKAFPTYPVAVRLKKLTYAMPIMAKEIRLTKDSGMVIASTSRVSQRGARTNPAQEVIQLDATHVSPKVLPSGRAVSSGDYAYAIHRNSDGTMMRWANLPIRVYVKSSGMEGALTTNALRAWQESFSVQPTSTVGQADIVVSWEKSDWDVNTSGALVRPVTHLDDTRRIRTVVMITMYPARGLSAEAMRHAVSHQLGHAFGLWGHSDNPGDLMYPALSFEVQDFPSRWRWRSAKRENRHEAYDAADVLEPSQRDINTLLKIYDEPANDLASYTPY